MSLSPQSISCEATAGCKGHALLPGGSLLIIDNMRHCWACASAAKKQKDKCVRVPLIELQTALDLINKGVDEYETNDTTGTGFGVPMSIIMARQILNEILEQKGATDG